MTQFYRSKLSLRSLLLGAACVGACMMPSAGYATSCVIGPNGDCQGSQQAEAIQEDVQDIVAKQGKVEPSDLFGSGSILIQGDDKAKNDEMKAALEELKKVYENLGSSDLQDALMGVVLSLAKEGAANPEAIKQLASNFAKIGTSLAAAKINAQNLQSGGSDSKAGGGGGLDIMSLLTKTLTSSLFGSNAQTLASGQFSPEKLFNQVQQASGSVRAMDLSGYKDLGKDWPEGFVAETGSETGISRTYEGDDPQNPGTNMTVVKHRTDTKSASVAWANNNPGNHRPGSCSRALGIVGKDRLPFVLYPSPKNGIEAKKKFLFTCSLYKNLSIGAAIQKYAPGSDNNNPVAYANTIASAAGVSSGAKLSQLSADQKDRLFAAMGGVEGWKPGRVLVNRKTPAAVPLATTVASTTGQTSGGFGPSF
jgi:hypothetical protein